MELFRTFLGAYLLGLRTFKNLHLSRMFETYLIYVPRYSGRIQNHPEDVLLGEIN